MIEQIKHPQRWEAIALVVIVLVALFLRVYRLGEVPPGLTHDEASNGHDAAAVLEGVRPIYFTVGYGHEPLYPYSVAAVMAFLGPSDIALRLTTVGWSLILLTLTYLLTRRLFGPLPGLLAVGWMAIAFWPLMTSRVGLRAITVAVTFTASVLAFWFAFPELGTEFRGSSPARRRWLWIGLSGLFLGLSIYTYMASRVLPTIYLAFLVYLILVRRWEERPLRLKRYGGGIAALVLVAAVVAAPLAIYLITHPGAETRVTELLFPLEAAVLRRDFWPLRQTLARTLPVLAFQGDPLWRYNVAGRPLLMPVSGGLFFGGVLVCLWHLHDPRRGFLLLWLLVGLAPMLVTWPDGAQLRSIAAQPAIFLLIGLGGATILRFLWERVGGWGRLAVAAGLVITLALVGFESAHTYFRVWAEHRDVRATYYHSVVEEAEYLDTVGDDSPVAVSALYPDEFHDPYTLEVSLQRTDLTFHWFDARRSLIFPAGGEVRVLIPSSTPLDEQIEPWFTPYAERIHLEVLRPDDFVTHFEVFRFDAAEALEAYTRQIGEQSVSVGREGRSIELPVDFGGVVELIGYELLTPEVGPREEVDVLTTWRVKQPPQDARVVLFSHLLEGDTILGQEDQLDVPSAHWQAGDVFVQLHRFVLERETEPGPYPLAVGVYERETLERFTVLAQGEELGNHVTLTTVEVREE